MKNHTTGKCIVIEIDSRDARFQSGIARYFDVLGANMPEYVCVLQIIFKRSPNIKDVRIVPYDNGVNIFLPDGFPAHTLNEAILGFIGRRLIDAENVIVKTNCLGCEGLAYMLRSRFYAKTIGVLHCLPHYSLNGNGGFPPVNPFFNMDHIILVCDHGREYLDGVKNRRPYSVIYNGLDRPKIKTKRKSDGVFRFIFANGLAAHKGFERIIPAIRRVSQLHKIEVLVLGGGECPDAVKQEISDLPIKILGLITNPEEIARYYEQSDCALFASYSEACSYAGIEAMSYNLPIISSDASGLCEMFGNSALYASSNDKRELNTEEYARNMVRVINNRALRLRLATGAYSRYLQRYTARKMVDNTLRLYKKLIS